MLCIFMMFLLTASISFGQVESTQRMIRIVGLSATLPNYLEVSGHLVEINFFFWFICSDRFDVTFTSVVLIMYLFTMSRLRSF